MGLNWYRLGSSALLSRRSQHSLSTALSKMSGYSIGEYALSANAAIAEVQGTSAINDLLAGIGTNPEFTGFMPAKTTARAELCLA